MNLLLIIFLFVWYILGLYGAIVFIKLRNKKYKRLSWRTKQIMDIPIIGLLGPITWVAGFILLFGQKKDKY